MRTLVLLLAALCARAADNNPAAERAVRSAVEQFNKAAREGDTATLATLLAEELVYVHSNALTENKAECLAALARQKPNFEMKPGWSVSVYGKAAVVRARATASLLQDGKPNQIPLDMMQVWVREGKAWKMVARHTTRLPQP